MGGKSAFTPPPLPGSKRSEQIMSGLLEKVHMLDPTKIEPNPYQPRKFFSDESIAELAHDIKNNGQLQAVIVIDTGERYVLVAGERRVRACTLIEKHVKAVIEQGSEETLQKDATRILRSAIMENEQREDLTFLERAESLFSLSQAPEYIQLSKKEFAAEVGISYTTFNRLMDLLNLSPYIKGMIKEGNIVSIQALENLSRLDEKTANSIFDKIVAEGLNAEQSQELIRASKEDKRGENTGAKEVYKAQKESYWCGSIKTSRKKIVFDFDLKKVDQKMIDEIKNILEKYKDLT